MAAPTHSPPLSPTTEIQNGIKEIEKPTSIDLWNVPSLVSPSPPSNTLLITNLQTPNIFSASSLQHLYNLLNDPIPLNSFAPLPSLRRIIISYPTTEAAIACRQALERSASLPTPPATDDTEDAETKQADRNEGYDDIRPMKIYFGEPTPLVGQYADSGPTAHLQAPSLGKLMFISPPPSPPAGWEIRDEDPPNKATHAEDLLAALAGLNSANGAGAGETEEEAAAADASRDFGGLGGGGTWGQRKGGHRRTGTLTVYDPKDHGDSEELPAVMVEDTTGDDAPEETGPLPTRTSRPPVELMDTT